MKDKDLDRNYMREIEEAYVAAMKEEEEESVTEAPPGSNLRRPEVKSRKEVQEPQYGDIVKSFSERLLSFPEEIRKIRVEWAKRVIHRDKQEEIEKAGRTFHKKQYLGMIKNRNLLELRNSGILDEVIEPFDLVRLHLELEDAFLPDYLDILRSSGRVEYGRTISRDIIVPRDITLHALHYVIQQAFGWQNSHLHRYFLPESTMNQLLKKGMVDWCKLVGILFRSPYMDENDALWDDDYERGKLKTWYRKKYTRPYLSLSKAESYAQCYKDIADFKRLHQGETFVVEYTTFQEESHGGVTTIPIAIGCYHVTKEDDTFLEDRAANIQGYFTKEMKFEKLPYGAIHSFTYEHDCNDLLERLLLGDVLTFGDRELINKSHPMKKNQRICSDCDELLASVQEVERLASYRRRDKPNHQPRIPSVTDTLFYEYDFGETWRVRITGSFNVVDLVKAGRITQEEIDLAMATVWKTRRPICIARDGLSVMDDVGGLSGFVSFLEGISIDAKKADQASKREKESLLEWAKGQGWSKRRSAPKHLL